MAVESTTQRKKSLSVRTIVLVILAVVATLFAVNNRPAVPVWPLGNVSLIVVIVISFVLGALIGWLFHSITARAPRQE